MGKALAENRSTIAKWIVVFLLPSMVYMIPCTELFTMNIKLFIMCTVFGISIVAFELMNLLAISMLFPILYIAAGVAPMQIAFSGWTETAVPIQLVGGI